MADVSGVSSSGGADQVQSSLASTSIDPVTEAQQQSQENDSYDFLQQGLVQGLAMQKAILPDQGK